MAANWAIAADEPALIPVPQKMERLDGVFQLSSGTRIYTDRASSETGKFLVGYLSKSTGYHFKISGKISPAKEAGISDGILLTTNGADTIQGDESYELTVATTAPYTVPTATPPPEAGCAARFYA